MKGPPGENEQLDAAEERIESYLDELLLTLRGRPREARRLLTEVNSHLRESIEAGLATGLDKPQAVDEALQKFGLAAVAAELGWQGPLVDPDLTPVIGYDLYQPPAYPEPDPAVMAGDLLLQLHSTLRTPPSVVPARRPGASA